MRTSQHTNKKPKQPQKGPQKKNVFTKYMQEKLAITVLVITLALFALIYVIYDIINTNQDEYNQNVLRQQEYDSRVIPYRRGNIEDRNGTVLATTDKVYNLIIDAKVIMSDEEDYLEPTIRALNNTFGYDSAELRTLITENRGKAYIRYARQLTLDEKETFLAQAEAINKESKDNNLKTRVKGIWFEDEYKRIYPLNSLACNVVGFATGDGAGGNGGIEQFYNSTLIGTNGREYGYLNDDSNLERVIKPPSNGGTIVSTIDVNIQNIVEKRIQEWQADPGAERVGVIVMDPNNGEILAMASDQMFDLNNPREVSDRFTNEEIVAFGQKEAMDTYNRKHPDNKIKLEQVSANFTEEEIFSYGQQVAWNQVWRNFAVSDTFEPGSPSKIFTVSAGLEEGIINGTETFFCDGFEQVVKDEKPIYCVKRTGHGNLTVTESLMQSCNDAMMQLAFMEGKAILGKYQKIFGFGSKTGIDLPGEADTTNLIYTEEDMRIVDLATNAFGQNYNCTMIQMAAAYASVINGGSYYEPHVVKQILNEQGSIVKKSEPVLVRETVSESTSNFINQALLKTVEEGTGSWAAVEGYAIAGKTGTAEKYPRSDKNYLLSFCGYAPANDPEVLVYVIIDTPHIEYQPQSRHASIMFQKIMTEILPYLNIFPDIDIETDAEELGGQFPEEEGISGSGGVAPEKTETPKVYETDEYIDPEAEDSGIPESLPGNPEDYQQNNLPSSTDGYGGNESAGNSSGVNAVPQTTARTGTAETAGTTAAQTARAETRAAETTAAPTTRAAATTAATTAAATTSAQTSAARAPTGETRASIPEETQRRPAETATGDPGQIPIVEPLQ